MRLLHVLKIINDDYGNPIDAKLAFEEFFDVQSTPKYAILSHTWGSEEVSYQALGNVLHQEHLVSLDGTARSLSVQQVKCRGGYRKIVRFCYHLWEEGLRYGWVDTCCIDKTSSAELSEAINSMYQWYEHSQVCLAYLADVYERYSFPEGQGSSRSRWFTRGWTLQELIAPEKVLFFDSEWKPLFSKASESNRLELHTGIDRDILTGAIPLTSASLAQRMSWACNRNTSRLEDIAYCLLGIFQVNMPLLYGEGKRAFVRLQEAIMQDSSDHSLFAWSDCDPDNVSDIIKLGSDRLSGLLASSPSQFAHAQSIVPYHHKALTAEYSMTNEGLRIKLPICEMEQSGLSLGILNCARHEHDGTLRHIDSTKRVAIYLRPVGAAGGQQYARCHYSDQVASATSQDLEKAVRLTIYVRKKLILGSSQSMLSRHGIHITSKPHRNSGLLLTAVYPSELWQKEEDLIRGPVREAALGFSLSSSTMVIVLIQTKPDAKTPGFEIAKIHCACRLIEGKISKVTAEETLKKFADSQQTSTSRSFADLNDGRRVIATVSKAKLLGEDVFTVDVNVVPDDSGLAELPASFPTWYRPLEEESRRRHNKKTKALKAYDVYVAQGGDARDELSTLSQDGSSTGKVLKRLFTKWRPARDAHAIATDHTHATATDHTYTTVTRPNNRFEYAAHYQPPVQLQREYDWEVIKPGLIRVIDFYSSVESGAWEQPMFSYHD